MKLRDRDRAEDVRISLLAVLAIVLAAVLVFNTGCHGEKPGGTGTGGTDTVSTGTGSTGTTGTSGTGTTDTVGTTGSTGSTGTTGTGTTDTSHTGSPIVPEYNKNKPFPVPEDSTLLAAGYVAGDEVYTLAEFEKWSVSRPGTLPNPGSKHLRTIRGQ